MKIFWLTPGQIAGAVLLGLVAAVFVTFLTAPQPVEVPVQIITPVPTPPPVVITEQPAAPAPASGGYVNAYADVEKSVSNAFSMVWLLIVLTSVTAMFIFLLSFTGRRPPR